jgi:hypothetical protein
MGNGEWGMGNGGKQKALPLSSFLFPLLSLTVFSSQTAQRHNQHNDGNPNKH